MASSKSGATLRPAYLHDHSLLSDFLGFAIESILPQAAGSCIMAAVWPMLVGAKGTNSADGIGDADDAGNAGSHSDACGAALS